MENVSGTDTVNFMRITPDNKDVKYNDTIFISIDLISKITIV